LFPIKRIYSVQERAVKGDSIRITLVRQPPPSWPSAVQQYGPDHDDPAQKNMSE
jgi:hypothetical protein